VAKRTKSVPRGRGSDPLKDIEKKILKSIEIQIAIIGIAIVAAFAAVKHM
jgi:hypothetical protein